MPALSQKSLMTLIVEDCRPSDKFVPPLAIGVTQAEIAEACKTAPSYLCDRAEKFIISRTLLDSMVQVVRGVPDESGRGVIRFHLFEAGTAGSRECATDAARRALIELAQKTTGHSKLREALQRYAGTL